VRISAVQVRAAVAEKFPGVDIDEHKVCTTHLYCRCKYLCAPILVFFHAQSRARIRCTAVNISVRLSSFHAQQRVPSDALTNLNACTDCTILSHAPGFHIRVYSQLYLTKKLNKGSCHLFWFCSLRCAQGSIGTRACARYTPKRETRSVFLFWGLCFRNTCINRTRARWLVDSLEAAARALASLRSCLCTWWAVPFYHRASL
jgi:hypothetical protein